MTHLRIVAAFAALLIAGCTPTMSETEQDQPSRLNSEYSAIGRGRVDVEGGIIQIAAPRDGVIRQVLVDEGDRVARGQVLAQQDGGASEIGVRQSAAELAEARGRLPQLQSQLASARRELARQQAMLAEGATPRLEVDQARDRVRDIEHQIAASRLAVQTTMVRGQSSRFELQQRTIRAPVAGVIAKRNAQPGAGSSTLNVSTLFTLIPDAPRIVRAEVEERYVEGVTVGQRVVISPEYAPDRKFSGTVHRKAQILGQKRQQGSDETTERTDDRVVEVMVRADQLPLLIGQRVMVYFLRGAAK